MGTIGMQLRLGKDSKEIIIPSYIQKCMSNDTTLIGFDWPATAKIDANGLATSYLLSISNAQYPSPPSHFLFLTTVAT